MKKPRKLVTGFCAVIFALQSGCAVSPPSPEPAERGDITQLGTVALANVHFAPTTSIQATDPPVSTGSKVADAAKNGADDGMGVCVTLGVLGGPWGILFIPFCLPVGAVLGATYGVAVTGAPEPPEPIDATNQAQMHLEMQMSSQFSTLAQQKIFRDHIVQYAAESALPPLVILENQGPAAPDKLPAYYSPPNQSVDTVLEVGITDLSAIKPGGSDFTYRFAVTGRGRLLRIHGSMEGVGDSMVLDSFTDTFYTNSYTLDQWMADDGKLLATELARGYRDLAEAFVNKWLIHH